MTLRLIISLLGFAVCNCLFAQEKKKAEIWTSQSAGYKFKEKLEFEVEHQLRLKEDLPTYKNNSLETGLSYEPIKSLKGGLYLRYFNVAERSNRLRYTGQVKYKWGKNKSNIAFRHRIRYQRSYFLEDNNAETLLRKRFGIQYKFGSGTKFKILHEFFWLMSDGAPNFTGNRTSFILNLKLSELVAASLFYKNDVENDQVKNPDKRYILGIGLNFGLESLSE